MTRKHRIGTILSGVLAFVLAMTLLIVLPVRVSIDSGGRLGLFITSTEVLANPGWVSPTGFVDGGNVWTSETLAYDEDTGTYAYASALNKVWTNYLQLTHAALNCDKVQMWVSIGGANINTIEVDVYYGGAWHNIYSGTITAGQFVEYAIGSTQSVTAMQVRFYSTKAVTAGCMVHEADFNEVTATPDISNAPNTWVLNGIVNNGNIQTDTVYYANPQGDTTAPASTVTDADCRFTITNSSTMAIDLTCTMGSFTGGDSNMTNSDEGTNGNTTYGAYSWFSGQLYANKVVIKSAGSAVGYDALPALTDIKWGVEVETRTALWTGGTASTATLTITATVD